MSELLDLLKRKRALLDYELALREAEEDLLAFCQVTMPHKDFPSDPRKTTFLTPPHIRFGAEEMMAVERGDILKLIDNEPPRHGKSELGTRRMASWFSGRHPELDIIVATYNEDFAKDFGVEIRGITESKRFRQIFPDYELVQASSDVCVTSEGGHLYFLGRRSPTTGRGGHLILVDDPTKDDKEVRSPIWREDVWQWFTQTLMSRRHNDRCPIVVRQTRWHEDDIVGRITDPNNPCYSPKFAEGWRIINLPAIAGTDDVLGRKPGEALWPERFGLKYLEEMQEANPVAFAALYQSDPTPADGVFYSVDELYEYDQDELPESLTIYFVSDHAVSTKSLNDPSCMVPFGICPDGNAWVLPRVAWRRMNSQEAVEEMVTLMREMKPLFWYAEKGHISKAIGPFLKKRMAEEEVHCPVIEEQPVGDKLQRAQSARARCAQGKIRFPKAAPWWPRAKSELLKFPNGRFDDFVDCVSMIGLKIQSHVGPGRKAVPTRFAEGTFGYMLAQFREQDAAERGRSVRAGW